MIQTKKCFLIINFLQKPERGHVVEFFNSRQIIIVESQHLEVWPVVQNRRFEAAINFVLLGIALFVVFFLNFRIPYHFSALKSSCSTLTALGPFR